MVVTLLVIWAGYFALYGLGFFRKKGDSGGAKENSEEESKAAEGEPEVVKIEGCAMDFADKLPADRVFTLETLAQWDGIKLPMCVAVCGRVVDVSSSMNFTPVFGYGKLWGGRDASYALAHASLKAEDANVLEWDLEELGDQQKDSLKSFYKHFIEKYPMIGTLKEYEFRDFSGFLPPAPAIVRLPEEEATEQTAGGDGGKASEEAKASDEVAAKTASED